MPGASGLSVATALGELVESLAPPCKVMMLVKAGPAVDGLIDHLIPLLEPGDVIIDGGNTHWADTVGLEHLSRGGPHSPERQGISREGVGELYWPRGVCKVGAPGWQPRKGAAPAGTTPSLGVLRMRVPRFCDRQGLRDSKRTLRVSQIRRLRRRKGEPH